MAFSVVVAEPEPVYTAEQLAAPAAARKAAEELAAYQAALEIQRQKVAAAKAVVNDCLTSSKFITTQQFQDAQYLSTPKINIKLNAEILKLSLSDRLIEAKINSLIQALKYEQAFFDPNDRPDIITYNDYGFGNVNSRIIYNLNTSVLQIPTIFRTDQSVIKALILKLYTVDLISNPITSKSITYQQLVNVGLCDQQSPNKTTIVNTVKQAPTIQKDSYEKIQLLIALEYKVIQARADRLAAIKKKIQSRLKA